MNKILLDILYYLKISIYWIEVQYTKIGIKKSSEPIPEGMYCYRHDGRRGVNKKGIPWYGIKTCKYYRSMRGSNAGCTYVGFIGFEPCLGDQCKICGEKEDFDEEREDF